MAPQSTGKCQEVNSRNADEFSRSTGLIWPALALAATNDINSGSCLPVFIGIAAIRCRYTRNPLREPLLSGGSDDSFKGPDSRQPLVGFSGCH